MIYLISILWNSVSPIPFLTRIAVRVKYGSWTYGTIKSVRWFVRQPVRVYVPNVQLFFFLLKIVICYYTKTINLTGLLIITKDLKHQFM